MRRNGCASSPLRELNWSVHQQKNKNSFPLCSLPQALARSTARPRRTRILKASRRSKCSSTRARPTPPGRSASSPTASTSSRRRSRSPSRSRSWAPWSSRRRRPWRSLTRVMVSIVADLCVVFFFQQEDNFLEQQVSGKQKK